MFALRSAVALTCLVAAAGRRHSDSYLTPEVGQAEEKTAEALESITPHGGDGHLIPLSASLSCSYYGWHACQDQDDALDVTRVNSCFRDRHRMSAHSQRRSFCNKLCPGFDGLLCSADKAYWPCSPCDLARVDCMEDPWGAWNLCENSRADTSWYELFIGFTWFYHVLPCFTLFYRCAQHIVASCSTVPLFVALLCLVGCVTLCSHVSPVLAVLHARNTHWDKKSNVRLSDTASSFFQVRWPWSSRPPVGKCWSRWRDSRKKPPNTLLQQSRDLQAILDTWMWLGKNQCNFRLVSSCLWY